MVDRRWLWLCAAFLAAQARVERSYCDDENCGFKCSEGAKRKSCWKDRQCKARCRPKKEKKEKPRDRTVVTPPRVAPCVAPCDFVRKTVFEEEVRFLYTAGLEHTGHHLWQKSIWPVLDGESGPPAFSPLFLL